MDIIVPKTDEAVLCKCCGIAIGFDNTFTDEGKLEAKISGMCEVCFDYNTLQTEVDEMVEDLCEDYDVINAALNLPGAYVGGGIFRTMVDRNDVVMDIDVFFNKRATADLYMEILEELDYNQVFACPQGELYTYKRGDDVKVQLITKFFYPSVEELVDSFDITACCAGHDGSKFYSNRRFFTDVMNKNIYLNKITYPVATLNRITKYVKKGYSLSATANMDFVEFVNQVELDENNIVYYVD